MKTSGSSITVTSLTDVAAFAVGATTVSASIIYLTQIAMFLNIIIFFYFEQLLPGLKSFCIYSSVGIVAVFFFQITFFVGWLAIDQRRLESRRNAFFFCKKYKPTEYIPNKWSQSSYLQIFFEKFLAPIILSKIGKVCKRYSNIFSSFYYNFYY